MSREQTVDALKLAYRKLHMGDESVGSDEVADAMCNALCEEIGDDGFDRWLRGLESEAEDAEPHPHEEHPRPGMGG